MRSFHTLFIVLFAIVFANAQTSTWTGSVDQNWSNADNWNNGLPVAGGVAILPSGAPSPVLAQNLTLNFEVQNFVTLRFDGSVVNDGHFINFNGGTVENRAAFVNNGTIQFDNGGRFDNHNSFQNNGSIAQTGTGTWYNHPFSNFTNGAGGSFTNYGYLENNGFLTNNGSFANAAELVNRGVLTNNLTLLIGFGAGKITNDALGIISNGIYATLDVQGILDNSGNIVSTGAFKISATGQFLNKGIFSNLKVARNFGQTINTGIYNNGVLGLDTAGIYQYNDYGGTFRNQKTLNNLGTLELMPCSEFFQESITGDAVTGRVWLMGIVYEISGLVDQNNIMGGVVLHGTQTAAPTAICKSVVMAGLDATGNMTVTPQMFDNGSHANYCEIASLSVGPNQFNCSHVGVQLVTLTVTDAKGTSSSCTSMLKVQPSAACPGCFNITNPGTISGDQTICEGETAAPMLSITDATGGVGTPEYVWIYWTVDPVSAPNAFTMILGSNSPNFAPGALTTTTWFRRCSRSGTCQDFIAETNFLKITVNKKPSTDLQIVQPDCQTSTGSVNLANLTPAGSSVKLDGNAPQTGVFSFSNLAPGAHTIFMEKDGCTKTLTFSINNAPNVAPVPQISIAQPACNLQTGIVSVLNVPAGFQVKIDNGLFSNQTIFTGIVPGNHTLTIGQGGCEKTADFTILPFVAPLPNVICRSITVQLVNGNATITAAQIDNGSDAGGCGSIVNYTLSQSSFNAAGTFTVTLTVTTSAGQTSSCTATVVVESCTNPNLNISQPGLCQTVGSATITNLPAGYSSKLDNGTYVLGQTTFSNLAPGPHTISIQKLNCTTSANFTILAGQTTPTPQFSVTQPTNCGQLTGSISISNLPTGFSSKLDNGVWTLGQTIYTGISNGQHTVTIGKDGCDAAAIFNIVSINNLTPPPTISIVQPICGQTTGSINITNLPAGYSSSLDGGAWILGKTSYTGISIGQHTIAIGKDGCNNSTAFAINFNASGLVFDGTKCFKITNKVSGKALSVMSSSTADGADIVQWDYTGTANQVWKFIPAGNGFYYLTANHSGKVVDIEGSSQTQHTYANQWTNNGGANQQFSVESIGGGYFKIVVRHSCQVIKLSASPGTNGTRVFQAVYSSSYEHAKWKIEEVPCTGNINPPPPPPATCNKNVLFVVGCTTLNSGDSWVKNRLQQLGLTVSIKDDYYVNASDATGKGLIIISSTSNSGDIGSEFTNSNIPVITWEPNLLDDLRMVYSSSKFGWSTGTWMKINSSTEITAGVSTGWQQVFSGCSPSMGWGIPQTGCKKFADIDPEATVFAYETGSAMFGMNAPARRVSLFLNDWSATCLNSNGRKIFDNAIEWAINCTLPNLAASIQSQSLTFNAAKKGFAADLSWISTTGERNDYFVIERSGDGQNFRTLAKIDGKGSAGERLYFNELDENPLPGDNFYRLRLIYADGNETYSDVQILNFPTTSRLDIFPNPTSGQAWMDLKDFTGKNVEITLVNQVGLAVRVLKFENVSQAPESLDLTDLPNGFYTAVVVSDGVRKASSRLIISKLD